MDSLQLSVEIIKKAEVSLEQGVLNERQCRNLLRNFSSGLDIIQRILGGSCTNVFDGAKADLFRIVCKVRALTEDCRKIDWLKAAVKQIDNKEAFRELVTELECCFDTICGMSECHFRDRVEEIIEVRRCTTFFPASIGEVNDDLSSITERLVSAVKQPSCARTDGKLAGYLLGRIRGLERAKGGGLGIIVFPDHYPRPKYGERPVLLGGDKRVPVYATEWLGLESATKVTSMCGQSEEWKKLILKEAGILGGLNHPNIIKLFCCGFSERREEFELIMERGKMTLSEMLEERGPLPERIAMDVMLQIASGMCYMHDMKVAHRDLKPKNVVVNPAEVLDGADKAHVHVKLLDFGISKHEVKSTPEVPTGGGTFGTVLYMAPEAIKENAVDMSLPRIDPLKADAFSFGMVCSEIVLGSKPFDGKCSLRDYRAKVMSGERPRLPNGCRRELKSLIESCWSLDAKERPTFLEIHSRLTTAKKAMVQGSLEDRGPKCEERTPWNGVVLDPKQWWMKLKKTVLNGLWQCFAIVMQCLWFLLRIGKCDSTTPLVVDVENLGPSDRKANEANNGTSECRKLVGVERKVLELERKLQDVGSLGIVGTGGIGKSTLAEALSSHMSPKFEATCFVDGLKDGYCRLALRDKLKDTQERTQACSLREGQEILERVRKSKKVLIVLDDVGSECPLHDLLGSDKFRDDDGSKLIATSRTWKLLEEHVSVHGKVDMAVLDEAQSMKLFSMHAFASNQSCLPHLKDVAEKIVNACHGLPLSLEVMGTLLHGNRRLRIWERTLYRLLRARDDGNEDEKIWQTLRISFDDLNVDEKSMFLDVSSFFCEDSYPGKICEEELLRILNDDDKVPKEALENLKDKSLVKVDTGGYITMHDQLRDMGRMLAEREFGGSRDRELCLATFNDCNKKSLEVVQGLSFTRLEHKLEYQNDMEVNSMDYSQLRLLIIHLCEDFELVSKLVEQTCKLRCLIIHFSSEDDVVNIQKDTMDRFWKIFGHGNLSEMRVLHLDNCRFLESFPNKSVERLPLTDLHLKNCENMKVLSSTLWNMTSLVSLCLINCPALVEVPEELANLIVLKELKLIKCSSLKTISSGLGSLTCLKRLCMWRCGGLEEFPSGLGKLFALEDLDISGCKKLKVLPEGFGSLTCLKRLDMQGCDGLEEFPSGLGKMVALKELNITLCKKLKVLPEGFGSLTCLKRLDLGGCDGLEEFPSGLGRLIALEELDISGCEKLKVLPEGFGSLTCLKRLYMQECDGLEEFPSGFGELVALEELDISWCEKLKVLPEGFGSLTCLKRLYMQECDGLEEFPSGLGKLVALEELDISCCEKLKVLPEGFGSLTCLKRLCMWDCDGLEEFPSGLGELVALEKLDISGCKKLKVLPEAFGSLTCLKRLHMRGCDGLEEFPSGLGKMVALEELDISGCKKLKVLPGGFGSLICLKTLRLRGCDGLEEFPSGLGKLVALEELDISGCKKLKVLPEAFGSLTCLKRLCMWGCDGLEEFASGLENLFV